MHNCNLYAVTMQIPIRMLSKVMVCMRPRYAPWCVILAPNAIQHNANVRIIANFMRIWHYLTVLYKHWIESMRLKYQHRRFPFDSQIKNINNNVDLIRFFFGGRILIFLLVWRCKLILELSVNVQSDKESTCAKKFCEMAEETFKLILAAETPKNDFKKWFLDLFQVSGNIIFSDWLTKVNSKPKRLNFMIEKWFR